MYQARQAARVHNHHARPYTAQDLEPFAALLQRIGPHGHLDWPASPRELKAYLDAPRVQPRQNLFVTGQRCRLTAYAFAYPELNIDRAVIGVGVEPELADTNLTRQLIDRALDRAREQGAKVAHLADDKNPTRTNAIRQIGFKPVARMLRMSLSNPSPDASKPSPIPNGFSLRRGKQDEATLLTSMQNEVFEGSWGYSPNSVEEVEARLRMPGTGPENLLIVEDDHGRAAAFNWTRIAPPEPTPDTHANTSQGNPEPELIGYIQMTGVLPDYRGAGLGSSTVAAGVAQLANAGAKEIHLEVIQANKPALHIYTRAGFKTHQIIDWYELALA